MGIKKGVSLKSGYSSLKIGMGKDEVFEMFGEPNSQKVKGEVEIYGWWSHEFKGMLRGGSIERRVTVEFERGLVVGYDGENIDASIL